MGKTENSRVLNRKAKIFEKLQNYKDLYGKPLKLTEGQSVFSPYKSLDLYHQT